MSKSAPLQYKKHYDETKEIIEEIRDVIADSMMEIPGSIHWGHVGDMQRTRDQLAEIRDQLLGLGEYAE